MTRKHSYEYIKHFIEVESNSNCKLISKEYINCKENLTIECRCEFEYVTPFSNFSSGKKMLCDDCRRSEKGIKIGKKRKTHTEFLEEVTSLGGHDFLILGEYQGYFEKIKVKHLPCDRIWDAVPSSLISGIQRGGGCIECSRKKKTMAKRKTPEKFEEEVYSLVGDEYIFLEKYELAAIQIRVWHRKCNLEYLVSPNSFLTGSRCNVCAMKESGMNQRKEDSTFKEEVFELVGDEYSFLEKYQKNNTKIKVRHNKCGETYKVQPSNFLSGGKCPFCMSSKGEIKIANILRKREVDFEKEKKFDGCRTTRPLPFDFYVNKSLLIEYDGEFHFQPARFSKNKEKMIKKLKSTQRNDRVKNEYCIENKISLVRIPYWELDNIETILDEVLAYFNVLSKSSIVNYNIKNLRKYIVNEYWDHDVYINSHKQENRDRVLEVVD